jgi:hypothetical protein
MAAPYFSKDSQDSGGWPLVQLCGRLACCGAHGTSAPLPTVLLKAANHHMAQLAVFFVFITHTYSIAFVIFANQEQCNGYLLGAAAFLFKSM